MEGHSHPCVKLLAAHAYRWGKHDIFLPWRTAYNFRSVQNKLPLFEALEIERFGDNDEPPLQADVLDYFSVSSSPSEIHSEISPHRGYAPNALGTAGFDEAAGG